MKQLILMLMMLVAINASAQNNFSITGTVTDENQKPIAGATVFIDGSQIATATDNTGKFVLSVPGPGSYHLLAKILGYTPAGKDVSLRERSATVNFALKIKLIALNQVDIGANKIRSKYLETFKRYFLGISENAQACKIVNPGVIHFSTQKNILFADADEFLIIENPNLGYRIKYLLKTFQHNSVASVTAYDGNVVFEELPGTDRQKKNWAKNRLDAYNGSLMHFLRSIFNGTAQQEGFVGYPMYQKNDQYSYETKPLDLETMVTVIDTSFVSLRFKMMYLTYDPPGKLLKLAKTASKDTIMPVTFLPETVLAGDPHNRPDMITLIDQSGKVTNISDAAANMPLYSSGLSAYVDQVSIDKRGRVSTDYLLSFLVIGDWSHMRVANQLPFEYLPPTKISSKR